jgi:NitT/TauT family transport system substrate-binding protein
MIPSIRRLGLVALAALFSFVPACRKSEPRPGDLDAAAAPTRVKVQLNWVPEPEFGGLYAAREGGAYRRAGLDVDIVGGGPGTPVVQLVAAGKADFAIAGADDVVTARVRGVDVVAVFGTFQTSPQGIIVHAARNLSSLSELKSGTLALEPGLPFGMFMKKKFGFPGVSIVPYDGGIAKFLADPNYAQQCYVTSEPIAIKKKGETPKVFLGADAGFNPYTNVIITRGAMLREKLPVVRAFVSASAEGWRAYLADPRPANATMHKLNAAMDEETFAAAAEAQKPLIENADTAKYGLGAMTEARWSTLAEQLKDLGVIDKTPPAAECFANVLPAKN